MRGVEEGVDDGVEAAVDLLLRRGVWALEPAEDSCEERGSLKPHSARISKMVMERVALCSAA